MTQNKYDKNPVIQLDLQAIDLYILAYSRAEEAELQGYDLGFAVGVMQTLDWLRGEAPYPFDTDDAELEESPPRADLRPCASELFHVADLGGE